MMNTAAKKYTSFGQPYKEQETQELRLRTFRNDPWFYAHYPNSWDLIILEIKKEKRTIKKPVFLPRLRKISEIPGVNGSRTGYNRVDSSLMKARMVEEGWTILEPKQFDYLRLFPCINGTYYTHRFVEVEDLAGDIIEEFNHHEFNAWRVMLMAEGYIRPPHPHIIKKLIIRASKGIDRISRFQHIPEQAIKLKQLQQKYKDMNAALKTLQDKGRAAYE